MFGLAIPLQLASGKSGISGRKSKQSIRPLQPLVQSFNDPRLFNRCIPSLDDDIRDGRRDIAGLAIVLGFHLRFSPELRQSYSKVSRKS
jgi:hypothetical protein